MAKPRKDRGPRTSTKAQNFELREVVPLTKNQEAVWEAWEAGQHLFLAGSAGTGKTFVGLFLGLREGKKVLVIRSAVPSRNVGFLPGNIKEKAEVYEEPYRDACNDLYQRGDAYEVLKTKGMVEFCLTSYMRGITIAGTTVIVDETQNLSYSELRTVITRMGEGSRIIFCGDFLQSDLVNGDKNGILRFMKIIKKMKRFACVKFTPEDIVRSGLVKEFLLAEEDIDGDGVAKSQMGYLDV